ncbi:AI-2E family transporter [Naumannella cuiyingiana]|uniref:Putative PurR-regulated permease PerM n=1 Tax=Naumannella cuiyingiana TaxID=1347891 RepID=A0A7Z0IJM3_9ACTN|nr:putative PurR-regulated permease PerM [Naumannella cuiyingiana]
MSADPARRGLLGRLRGLTTNQPTDPPAGEGVPGDTDPGEAPPPAPSGPIRSGLAQMSPFAVGFLGTLGVLAALGVGLMVIRLQSVIMLVVLSLFIALGLNPLVEFLTRRGLRRGIGVLGVAVIGLGLVALALWAIIPIVIDQVNSLSAAMPAVLDRLLTNPRIAALDHDYQISQRLSDFIGSGQWANQAFGGLLGAGVAVANTVFSLVVTIVLTLYFLISLPSIKRAIYQLAPASRRPRARYLADKMMRQVGGYLTGMFFVSLCAATCAFIFLNIAGIGRYALALAIVVALFAFIPLVGSTISLTIVALIGFSLSIPQGVACVIYGLVYQQFDAYVIQPRVFQRSVDVPGVIVVIAAISGGILYGVVGAILAIPVAAVLLLLYREVLVPRLDRS